ncbi:MAG: HD domain-containing protein [Streptococcus orisratti]|uniref:HD domain-containing protein n=1 Tax=Streptococcus orisratti TaxID=114652 RepID=UPI002A9139E7|nr:HD domain-containing protein [Streptococcus orisratti]MDY5636386.1 HD domain-containing protein [Streptococcus orisratti]
MINKKMILEKAEQLVRSRLEGDSSGHDWWHIVRVRNTARTIAMEEKADVFLCEMAALLHDMADDKLTDQPEVELANLQLWLANQGLTEVMISNIIQIITTMSFKGGGGQPMVSLEGKIVQDADRLDAIGAIGIARCMAYSGSKGRLIHDPTKQPREQLTPDEYRNGQDTAIMHFYEKLLKLKDLMNTDFGRKMAEQRHQYLENFLTEFYAEWDGQR